MRIHCLGVAIAAFFTFGVAAARAEGPPESPFSGRIEAGTYWSSDDAYRFGDFTGLGEDEWNVLGNFELRGRPAWDGGETWNFLLRGDNLGLDSRRISGRGGIQGLFDLNASWDQIPHLITDEAELAFDGRGTGLLTLPGGWIPSATTRGFGALGQSLDPLRLERERRDFRFGSRTELPHGFQIETKYKYDRQVGRKDVGSVIGNTGGNPRAVIVPAPVDWRTHDGDFALRYASERLQGEIGYEISRFSDEEDSLTWQNPFSAIGGWDPAAGYATGFGRRGMPPDNIFHQVKASGGYDLPFQTRVMAHVALGWMKQDDSFLDYTVNPALVVNTPLPRDDLDAEIETRAIGVRVTSRPIDRLRAVAEWRLDDRDNDTPRDTYIYVPGDSLDQSTVDSDRARRNLPNSYRRNDGRIELGYEIFERTEISAGYEREQIDRSWTEADEVTEDQFRVGLHSRPIEMLDLRIDGTWSDRDGGDYFYNAPLAWGFSPEHVAEVDLETDFENNPLLRKFNFADRERIGVDARLGVVPHESVSLGAQLGWANDDFQNSQLGLQSRSSLAWGFDASWTPLETLTTYVWYSNDSYDSRQRGRSFSNATQASDPSRNWRQRDEDRVNTVGAGFEWSAIADRLTLRADFAYAKADDEIDVETGPGLPGARSFPTSESTLFDASVQAEVRITDHVKTRVGYMFESFEVEDWAVDGVDPSTINEVLTLGEESPDYDAHLIGFSVEYGF
jgi:MtrB/PioB family decaheme-associated outer membrane protein